MKIDLILKFKQNLFPKLSGQVPLSCCFKLCTNLPNQTDHNAHVQMQFTSTLVITASCAISVKISTGLPNIWYIQGIELVQLTTYVTHSNKTSHKCRKNILLDLLMLIMVEILTCKMMYHLLYLLRMLQVKYQCFS